MKLKLWEESVMLCHHMTPCNISHTRTTRKGHSELKLIFQHFNHTFHAIFPHCCQAIDNWPPNLQFSTPKLKRCTSNLSIKRHRNFRLLVPKRKPKIKLEFIETWKSLQVQLAHQGLMPWIRLSLAAPRRQTEQEFSLQLLEPPAVRRTRGSYKIAR